MKKGVIFDMDGVLVDNRDVHIEAFGQLFDKYRLPFDREKFMSSFGMTNDQIFQYMIPDHLARLDLQALGVEKEEIYRGIMERTIAPAPGLVVLLKGLRQRGVKIAVGSSAPAPNVDFVLERCQIGQYFDEIANGDMVARGKPDPEVYLLAAMLLELDPSECVVCEDAPVGIEAARGAGMAVVALATTFSRNELSDYDLLIDNFTHTTPEELLAL